MYFKNSDLLISKTKPHHFQHFFTTVISVLIFYILSLPYVSYGNQNKSPLLNSDERVNVSIKSGQQNEKVVFNPSQIKEIMKSAQPGDVIVMASGVWVDAQIILEGHGSKDAPITLKAQEPGKVILTGKSTIRIVGSHLVVDGLIFKDGYSPKGSVIEFRNGSANPAHHCRVTNCAVIDYNPPSRDQNYNWIFLAGSHNRVDHNYLKGKDHVGPTIVVALSDQPNYHQIDHNYLGFRPPLGQNGGEAMRIGTSNWSLHDSYTVVEYNYFERCNGEGEIISSKSCENIYRYNTFYECEGALTLRHGNRCRVEGNFFLGNNKDKTGGIRIIGEDHVIINNYFEHLRGKSVRSAISFVNGIPDSPLFGYYQVKRALVAFNTFYNCWRNFSIGVFASEKVSLPVSDSKIVNNAIYGVTSDTIITVIDNPKNMTFEGNIVYGAPLGVSDVSGFKVIDPELYKSDDGLWRPTSSSPLIGAAVGDYLNIQEDMDGQPRTDKKDVGADQFSDSPIVRKPITAKDACPNWYKGDNKIVMGKQVYPPLPSKKLKKR